MKSESHYKGVPVRVIPWWLKLVLFFANPKGVGFNGVIYLRNDFLEQYTSGKLDARMRSIMAHEATHIERAQEKGSLRWVITYFLSSPFRLQEELEAIKAEMQTLKGEGASFDIDDRARKFSSSGYLWMASYDGAKQMLTDLWEEAGGSPATDS